MNFKTIDIRTQFVQKKVDGRLVLALRVGDSLAIEYTRSMEHVLHELTVTSAGRTRSEQTHLNVLNNRRLDFKSKHEQINGVCGAVDVRVRDMPHGFPELLCQKLMRLFPEVSALLERFKDDPARDHVHLQVRDWSFRPDYTWRGTPVATPTVESPIVSAGGEGGAGQADDVSGGGTT